MNGKWEWETNLSQKGEKRGKVCNTLSLCDEIIKEFVSSSLIIVKIGSGHFRVAAQEVWEQTCRQHKSQRKGRSIAANIASKLGRQVASVSAPDTD